jgi:hypothetical protein
MALFFLVMAFLGGLLAGLLLAATWEVDRHAREAKRLVSPIPAATRPTLSQRLAALEERVRTLEQRQTPCHRPLFLDNSIPSWSRCKVTQQPEEVAYTPKTPTWAQGPATAGGGAIARKAQCTAMRPFNV